MAELLLTSEDGIVSADYLKSLTSESFHLPRIIAMMLDKFARTWHLHDAPSSV